MARPTYNQVVALENNFNEFAERNAAFHAEKKALYDARGEDGGVAWQAFGEAVLARRAFYAADGNDKEAVKKEYDAVRAALPESAASLLEAYILSDANKRTFQHAAGRCGISNAAASKFIEKIQSISEKSETATADQVHYRDRDGKTYSLAQLFVSQKQQAPDFKEKGAIGAFSQTLALVQTGKIIDVDGTSPKHDGARIEIASALTKYFGKLNSGDAKALGLKEGETLNCMNESGDGLADRKLLDKALRRYQENENVTPDGRVGEATVKKMLFNLSDGEIEVTPYLAGEIAQTQLAVFSNEHGHLGGKQNPFSLRDYKDNKNDPMDKRKQAARDNILNVEAIVEKLKDVAAKQGLTESFTQAEKDAVAAIKFDPKQGITNETVKGLEKAFGLKLDKGIIGSEVGRTLAQIDLRLAVGQVVDPSEVSAAVQNLAPRGRQPSKEK